MFFSCIIPVYNRPDEIDELLTLNNLELKKDHDFRICLLDLFLALYDQKKILQPVGSFLNDFLLANGCSD